MVDKLKSCQWTLVGQLIFHRPLTTFHRVPILPKPTILADLALIDTILTLASSPAPCTFHGLDDQPRG